MNKSPSKNVDLLTQLHPSLWRAHQIGSNNQHEVICSGYAELDKQLPGGGWAGHQCTELLSAYPGIGEISFLVPALQQITLKKKRIVFVNPPFLPSPHVLQQLGVANEHVVLINTPTESNCLWATEQLIQSNTFGALLAWLPENKKLLQHSVLKRLQHHAHASNGLSFLFRHSRARDQASPTSLRLELLAKPNNQIDIYLVKRKGPLLASPITLDLPRTSYAPAYEPYQSQEFFDAMDRHLPSVDWSH